MKIAKKSFCCGKKTSSARVVDGKLILSYPEAITPVVWQMDLAQAKSSALEVRENAAQGIFILTLKTMKNETVDVAPFATKAEAVTALMAVARALENAQGQIRPFAIGGNPGNENTPTAPKKGKGGRWLSAILGILLILSLLVVWNSMAPRAPTSISSAATQQTGAPAANFGGSDEPGVPMSADEFLMKKPQ